MDDNEKKVNRPSGETKNHKIVNKSKDLWREKERRRLLDQAKIEEFERAERRTKQKAFTKNFIVFALMTATIIFAVYLYDAINADYFTNRPVICKLRKGTTEEKLEAIDSLGKMLNPNTIESLIEVYPDKDESVNIAILETLAGPWDGRCIEPLTKAMSHEDSSIRTAAVISLGNMTDHSVVPILFEALSDSDEKVREMAFIVLSDDNGKMKSNSLLPFLKKALHDKDEIVRELAARAFAKDLINMHDEVEFLKPSLKDSNGNVRRYIMITIANTSYDPEVYEQIIYNFLNDEIVSVRAEAARVLCASTMDDLNSLDYLIPVVIEDTEDPEVIRAALYSIIVLTGDYTTKIEDAILFKTLEDIVIDLAKKIKGEKYKYRHPLYVKAADDVLSKIYSSSLNTTFIFLIELGHPNAVPVLITALERENLISTSITIIDALGEFGDPRAIDTLMSALDDPDDEIRESAVIALEKITGQNFGEEKNKWRRWFKVNKHKIPVESGSEN